MSQQVNLKRGHFDRSCNKETEEIEKCQNLSSFCASCAKCVSLSRFFGSRSQSNIVGASFRRWYVAFELKNFRSCYHAHQCDRSPVSQSVSFCLCWGTGTNSWPHCDGLVLLISISTYCFLSFVLFVVQQSFCSPSWYLVLLPNLSRTLVAVYRIIWCFGPIGASRTEAVPRSSSVGRHQWHKWRWERHRWARRRLRPKKTYKMKKAWGTSDVGRFFVTGPTDVATKPSPFYFGICRKDVSVLTHGHHEILRQFQGSKHFPRDQRVRLETPGWELLDFEVNAMSPAEVERQREKILRAPLVVRDR